MGKQIYSVFRKGKWIQYEHEGKQEDPFLTEELKWALTSAYATARSKGFTEENSRILAEMHIFKKQFGDLVYSADLEADYTKLFW